MTINWEYYKSKLNISQLRHFHWYQLINASFCFQIQIDLNNVSNITIAIFLDPTLRSTSLSYLLFL